MGYLKNLYYDRENNYEEIRDAIEFIFTEYGTETFGSDVEELFENDMPYYTLEWALGEEHYWEVQFYIPDTKETITLERNF